MSRNEGRPLIAAAQYAPSFAKVDANRERAREAIMAAVALNCSIVVLPECCITGLVFEDKAQLRSVAEPLAGPSTREWKALAREHDIHIVAGLAEWDGAEIYNCAVLVYPSGGIVR